MLICILFSVVFLWLQSSPASADWKEPARGVGEWPEELGTERPRSRGDGSPVNSLGNHRAVVKVSGDSDAVAVRIPWRRRDLDADQKATLVYDASKDKRIENVARVEINREYGDIIFQPTSGAGEYYVYFMPYTYTFVEGSGDYRLTYNAPEDTVDAEWLNRNGLEAVQLVSKWQELPKAEVPEIQARTDFDRFDPMEVCATRKEISELIARNPGSSYFTFPEDRLYPIRMKDDLPLKWIESGPSTEFTGEACINEFYPFQIGVYSPHKRLFRIGVEFSDLKTRDGRVIPASEIRCFNSGGIDANGKPFTRALSIDREKVLALWIGVQVPRDATPGVYEGTVTIRPRNAEQTNVNVALNVTNEVLEDRGDSELWRHSRLRWLDSTIGIDDNVTAPYDPVKVRGRTVSVLLRDIRFGANGLPESITSKGNEILARPVRIVAETAGSEVELRGGETKLTRLVPAVAVMDTVGSIGGLDYSLTSETMYDGYIDFQVTLKAREAVDMKNLRLEVPFRPEVTTYLMGHRMRGGFRPEGDLTGLDSRVWMGDVHAGMQCMLGSGSRALREAADDVVLLNDIGEISLKAGDEKQISFQMLPTPLKSLDPDHWNWRYFQAWKHASSPERAERDGVKILSVHHANEYNPYINYPFLTPEKLGGFAADAKSRGIRVKYYYTLRELTNYAVELWAFRAVEPNMFPNRDRRGGSAWLQEHVFSDYDRAWHSWSANTDITDAAMHTTGNSRLMNYYLEGLYFLTKNLGNAGLYLDGIAFDRDGMRRVRKALDYAEPGCLIDYHVGRYTVVTNKYLGHMPYIDSLWLGEGFNYDEKPDYWMTEIAGLPFGLWGEMLHIGNPWRGMLYGMCNRLGWGGDSRSLWKLWDDFGIEVAEMIGYWEPDCPVKTDHEDVLATAYVKDGKTLISIGSWANEDVDVRLTIDWDRLGLSPTTLVAPEVEGFQDAATFSPSDEIPVPRRKGWLLIAGG